MTNRDKINWLKRYRILERRLKHRFDECEQLRSTLGKITATLSDMPKGGGSIYNSKDHSTINRIIDVLALMETDLNEWIDTRAEIEAAIKTVQGDVLQELLQYRYLDGLDWIHVAAAMNYSWRRTHEIHSKALNQIQITVLK